MPNQQPRQISAGLTCSANTEQQAVCKQLRDVIECRSRNPHLTSPFSVMLEQGMRDAIRGQLLERHAGTGSHGAADTFLSNIAPTHWYNEIRVDHDGDAAQRVFEVPELLERILLQLDSRDLMKVRKVQASFRDAVKASAKLRKMVLLEPDPDAVEFFSAIPRFRTGNVKPKRATIEVKRQGFLGSSHDPHAWTRRRDAWQYGTQSSVTTKLDIAIRFGHQLPVFSLGWEKMQICRPPVELVHVDVHCDECSGHTSQPTSRNSQLLSNVDDHLPIVNPTGVTVEDLMRRAEWAQHLHRHCVTPEELSARVTVTFRGMVKVPYSHRTSLEGRTAWAWMDR